MILPDQTIYELQALKIAMSWDYPFSSIEEMDAIIDRLRYSISETIITLLLYNQKHMENTMQHAHSELVSQVIDIQNQLYNKEITQEQFRSLTIEASDKYYIKIQSILNQ